MERFKHTLLAIVCTLLASCATGRINSTKHPLDYVEVDAKSGCITVGPISICQDPGIVKASLPWRIFDPTNSQRQQEVRARLNEVMMWENNQLQALPPSHPLTIRWHSMLATAAQAHLNATANRSIDKNVQNLIDTLKEVRLSPAIKVDLQASEIRVNRVEADRWISAVGSEPKLDASCTRNGVSTSCKAMLANLLDDDDFVGTIGEFRKFIRTEEGRGLISMLVTSLHFLKQSTDWMNSGVQRVYTVKKIGDSPQIDILGNLYIPEELLARLSASQLNIVLTHEAAHVINLEVDKLSAIVLEAQKAINHKSESTENALFAKVLKAARMPNEMLIDLTAAEYFSLTPSQLRQHADLLGELEGLPSARRDGLLAMSELVSLSIPASDIAHALSYATNVACQRDGDHHQSVLEPPKFALTATSRPPFEQYRIATSAYSANFAARRLIDMAGNKASLDEQNVSKQIHNALLKSKNGCIRAGTNTSDGEFHVTAATIIEHKESK